jgi:hypothetical protein
MRERFDQIIREYKESINKINHDLHSLQPAELEELINRLREQLFSDISSSSTNNNNNSTEQNTNVILRELFQQSHNQTELLRKLIEILPNLNDLKTIAKLVAACLFVWTVKTHIIDAYIKHK